MKTPARAKKGNSMQLMGKRFIPSTGMLWALLVMVTSAAMTAAEPKRSDASLAVKLQVQEAYGKLPLSFEANQGQTASQVRFLSRGPGYTLFLTPTEAVLALRGREN